MHADPAVRLARATLASLLTDGSIPRVPFRFPPPLDREAGVVVTLVTEPNYRLRGQAGNIVPRFSNAGEEIMDCVRRAAFEDARFEPLAKDELREVSVVVDLVRPHPQELRDLEDLNLDDEGLFMTTSKGIEGFVLPGGTAADGEEALSLILEKTGVDPEAEKLRLFRFTTERFGEVLL